jgi:formylglycine-generating enzyme required for sulfatase activity
VTVKPFEMAKTMTTNKQYKACVAAGACSAPSAYAGGDDNPVVNVDWNQAKAFAQWAEGRLPSEAEWEYAARSGGKDRKYPWGNDASCAKVVIDSCGGNGTAPVCSKPAGNTTQGLCDMAGNAWEWVQDMFQGWYEGAPTDGSAWEYERGPNDSDSRVIRGGDGRPAERSSVVAGDRHEFVSFRLAR